MEGAMHKSGTPRSSPLGLPDLPLVLGILLADGGLPAAGGGWVMIWVNGRFGSGVAAPGWLWTLSGCALLGACGVGLALALEGPARVRGVWRACREARLPEESPW